MYIGKHVKIILKREAEDKKVYRGHVLHMGFDPGDSGNSMGGEGAWGQGLCVSLINAKGQLSLVNMLDGDCIVPIGPRKNGDAKEAS